MKNKEKSVAKVDKNVEQVKDETVYVPNTDIYEKEDALLIRCDMPGVTLENVSINLDNNELEIVGTPTDSVKDDLSLLSGEYGIGVFRRKFSIPQLIDRDKIRASLKDGVLDIELPKAEEAKPRKIEIVAG